MRENELPNGKAPPDGSSSLSAPLPISVCILTKNSERTLRQCLAPLGVFDETLVLDTGSDDATLEIVAEFPFVRVLRREGGIAHFGRIRNELAGEAKNDWILMIDSDEVFPAELIAEIGVLERHSDTVYEIPRLNHYRERAIRGCGWYPDRCRRLYDRRVFAWSDRAVHEAINVPPLGKVASLKTPMLHFSYTGAEQLVRKTLWYAELFAEQHAGRRRVGVWKAPLHGSWAFFRSFFLRGGFAYGTDGLLISVCNGFGAYMKYTLLREKNTVRQDPTH